MADEPSSRGTLTAVPGDSGRGAILHDQPLPLDDLSQRDA